MNEKFNTDTYFETKQPKNSGDDIMNESSPAPQGVKSAPTVFDSSDFGKFLTEFPSKLPMSTFLSKESLPSNFLSKDSLPNFHSLDAFKSKDVFSTLFASADWEMKFSPPEPPKPAALEEPRDDKAGKQALPDVLTSREWMPLQTLGSHVDVSYDQEMFSDSEAENGGRSVQAPTATPTTDWDKMFFSQLELVPPPSEVNAQEQPAVEQSSEVSPAPQDHAVETPELSKPGPSGKVNKVAQAPKKKRNRKPRKKVVPPVKEYVEPKDMDVLLGRGGRSNHHPGNKRYREEVKNLQSWYLGIEDKDQKTDLSQLLVDYVHGYDGRFLEKDDEGGWYIVPNIVARRKASQALREDNDPVKRAAKRERYLKKKAEEEARAQQRQQKTR